MDYRIKLLNDLKFIRQIFIKCLRKAKYPEEEAHYRNEIDKLEEKLK